MKRHQIAHKNPNGHAKFSKRRKFVIVAVMMAFSSAVIAAQDPEQSISQMKSQLAAKRTDIANIEKQLTSTPMSAAQRKALLTKKNKLSSDSDSLRSSIAMGEAVRDTPYVLYGHDGQSLVSSKGDQKHVAETGQRNAP